jgi:hypothetical protein
MRKTAAILTILILAGACLVYQLQRQLRLEQELATRQRQCQYAIARLQSGYQEELRELQQYLLLKTNPAATSAAGVAPAAAGDPGRDESDAPEAFRKPALERYNESMEELVARKYRFLLANLSEADRQALLLLLVERERIALLLRDIREYGETPGDADTEELESRLAEIDQRIQDLLGAHDYQRYDLLKDSDNEQHHFTQFTLGINGVFPLNNGQQEAVLFAKIRYQKAFEASLRDSGLYADYPLTPRQRESLHARVQQAVETYQRGFLQEIKQYLDASSFPFDQYTLVENYTNTEFQQMLDEMRKKIDTRTAAP